MKRPTIYKLIGAERTRQATKWQMSHDWGQGDCSSASVAPTTKVAVLLEEAGEVARAVLDLDNDSLRAELVQVAAVAIAWLEGID